MLPETDQLLLSRSYLFNHPRCLSDDSQLHYVALTPLCATNCRTILFRRQIVESMRNRLSAHCRTALSPFALLFLLFLLIPFCGSNFTQLDSV
jgi:hypothetical protein